MSDVDIDWRTVGTLWVGHVCRAGAVVFEAVDAVKQVDLTMRVYVHGRCTATITVAYRDMDFWVQLSANVVRSQTERAEVASKLRAAPRPRNRKERRIVLAKTMLRPIQGGRR